MKRLHERPLWLIYNNKSSSYDVFLLKDGLVSIHHRNIQNLVTPMFIVNNDLSTEIFTDTFLQQAPTQYNLRHHNDFITRVMQSVYHSSKVISFLGANTQNCLPPNLKQLESFNSFKKQIFTWKPESCHLSLLGCSFRLCKLKPQVTSAFFIYLGNYTFNHKPVIYLTVSLLLKFCR